MGLFGKKKNKEESSKGMDGSFVGFILLDSVAIDIDKLVDNLRDEWGVAISEEDVEKDKDSIVAEIDGMMVAISLMQAPVPGDEAVLNARTNFRWPEAVAVAEAHKAHIMVAVLRREQSPLDAGRIFVKLCAACLRQPNATGANVMGSVIAPDFYCDFAKQYMEDDEFPLMNLVFFGLYSNDGGTTFSGYTYGMDAFGKKELEVIDSSQSADVVFDFLYNIASYVIESNVTLKDGETIGLTEDQKLAITESDAIAIDGVSLKIAL